MHITKQVLELDYDAVQIEVSYIYIVTIILRISKMFTYMK